MVKLCNDLEADRQVFLCTFVGTYIITIFFARLNLAPQDLLGAVVFDCHAYLTPLSRTWATPPPLTLLRTAFMAQGAFDR